MVLAFILGLLFDCVLLDSSHLYDSETHPMMDFVDQYVCLRFRLWSNRVNVYIIYEGCPEEGDDVSKKLREFNNAEDAEEWLIAHRTAYATWLRKSVVTSATMPPQPPPSGLVTSSALRQVKKMREEASKPTSTPDTTTSNPTEPSSSVTSPSQLLESVIAGNVNIGDRVVGRGTVDNIKKGKVKWTFTFKENKETFTVPPSQILEIQRNKHPF